MMMSAGGRRPDRSIYRPPSNRTSVLKDEKNGIKLLDDVNSQQKTTKTSGFRNSGRQRNRITCKEDGNRGKGSVISQEKLDRSPQKSGQSSSNSENVGACSIDQPQTYEIQNNKSRINDSLKNHGGLIRLPKNVNIYNQSGAEDTTPRSN